MDHSGELLERLAAASRFAFRRMGKGTLPVGAEFDELERRIVEARERIRRDFIWLDDGGAGKCHAMNEWLTEALGWRPVAVSYLSREGEVICCGHVVSLLADGTIVDATADQFGEGHDVRVVPRDHPDQGRYRLEFRWGFNPVTWPTLDPEENPLTVPDFAVWAELWRGEEDPPAVERLLAARGDGWWLEDKAELLAYLRKTMGCAVESKAETSAGNAARRIAALDQSFAADAPSL